MNKRLYLNLFNNLKLKSHPFLRRNDTMKLARIYRIVEMSYLISTLFLLVFSIVLLSTILLSMINDSANVLTIIRYSFEMICTIFFSSLVGIYSPWFLAHLIVLYFMPIIIVSDPIFNHSKKILSQQNSTNRVMNIIDFRNM